MLQEADIVEGTKVRCLRYGVDFGKVGTIDKIIGKFFYVRDPKGYEVGQGWTNTEEERALFDLEVDAISKSVPMDSSTKRVGTKVVCVLNHLYGMVGIIWKIDSDGTYHVQASNGEAIGDEGWSEYDSFNVISSKPNTLPMLESDKRVGTRVICVFRGATSGGAAFGRIGTITEVDRLGGYTVMDDNGKEVGRGPWTRRDSFNVVIEDPIKPKETVGNIVVESVTVSPVKTGPCPAYYYGVRACTCGQCSSGGALRFH